MRYVPGLITTKDGAVLCPRCASTALEQSAVDTGNVLGTTITFQCAGCHGSVALHLERHEQTVRVQWEALPPNRQEEV
jgi:mono/diheme cytochrome c family protein